MKKINPLTQQEIQEIIQWCFGHGVQYIRFENGLEVDWTLPSGKPDIRGPANPQAPPPREPATSAYARLERERNEHDRRDASFGMCDVCGDQKTPGKFGKPYCFNCWAQKRERDR